MYKPYPSDGNCVSAKSAVCAVLLTIGNLKRMFYAAL